MLVVSAVADRISKRPGAFNVNFVKGTFARRSDLVICARGLLMNTYFLGVTVELFSRKLCKS